MRSSKIIEATAGDYKASVVTSFEDKSISSFALGSITYNGAAVGFFGDLFIHDVIGEHKPGATAALNALKDTLKKDYGFNAPEETKDMMSSERVPLGYVEEDTLVNTVDENE